MSRTARATTADICSTIQRFKASLVGRLRSRSRRVLLRRCAGTATIAFGGSRRYGVVTWTSPHGCDRGEPRRSLWLVGAARSDEGICSQEHLYRFTAVCPVPSSDVELELTELKVPVVYICDLQLTAS